MENIQRVASKGYLWVPALANPGAKPAPIRLSLDGNRTWYAKTSAYERRAKAVGQRLQDTLKAAAKAV